MLMWERGGKELEEKSYQYNNICEREWLEDPFMIQNKFVRYFNRSYDRKDNRNEQEILE